VYGNKCRSCRAADWKWNCQRNVAVGHRLMIASIDKECWLIETAFPRAVARLLKNRRLFAIVETPCYGLKRRDYPVRARPGGPIIGAAVLETDSPREARWCVEFLHTLDADITINALLAVGPAPGTVTAEVYGNELAGFLVTPGGSCCNQQLLV
jgi:hypothetical protein